MQKSKEINSPKNRTKSKLVDDQKNRYSIKHNENKISASFNIRRIKSLLLIFLKQFDIEEYNFLIKYLRHMIEECYDNPTDIFGILLCDEKKKSNRFDQNILNKIQQESNNLKHTSLLEAKNQTKNLFTGSINLTRSSKVILSDEASREHDINSNADDATLSLDDDITNELMMHHKDKIIEEFILNDESGNETDNKDYDLDDQLDQDDYNYYNQSSQIEDIDESQEEQSDKNDDKTKSKNKRLVSVKKFSQSIRRELEKKFAKNNFISGIEKKDLANKLQLTERQVMKWFVHRREKLRRIQKENSKVEEEPGDMDNGLDSRHGSIILSNVNENLNVSDQSDQDKQENSKLSSQDSNDEFKENSPIKISVRNKNSKNDKYEASKIIATRINLRRRSSHKSAKEEDSLKRQEYNQSGEMSPPAKRKCIRRSVTIKKEEHNGQNVSSSSTNSFSGSSSDEPNDEDENTSLNVGKITKNKSQKKVGIM